MDGTVETRQITVFVEQSVEKPQISSFTVSPSAISAGQCVEIKWSVSGDITNVQIGRNEVTIWNNAPLTGHTSDCPPTGVATYFLNASGPGGSNRVQQNVTVSLVTAVPATATSPAGGVPIIDIFSIAPMQVQLMQCVTMSWTVTGDPDLVQIWRNDLIILGPAADNGSGQDCSINVPGSYIYKITAQNEAGQAVPKQVTVTAGNVGSSPLPIITTTSTAGGG
jgi:hypothetical protein